MARYLGVGPYRPTRGAFAGQEFGSHRAYLNALARSHGFANRAALQRAPKLVRTPQVLAALSPSERAARGRALDALSNMRRNPHLSLSTAAHDAHTTPAAVRKHTGAVIPDERGKLRTSTTDRLIRRLHLITADGPGGPGVLLVDVKDSRTATLLARHANAVRAYVEHGDSFDLREFRGRSVTLQGKQFRLLTDTAALDELAALGELQFETLYVS